MTNKNLQGIKKFKFFEPEKPEELEGQKPLYYSLNDMIPITLRIYDKYYYVAGKLKGDKRTNNTKLFRIVKIHPIGKIIEEYIPFTDCIIDFDIVKSEGKPYFVVIGTDLRNKDDKSEAKIEILGNSNVNKVKIEPSGSGVPSIKFFDMTNLQTEVEEKNEIEDEKNKDKEKPKEVGILKTNDVIYLMTKKDNISDFFKGNPSNLTEAYVPITNISCFSASPILNSVAFSFQDSLVEINLELSQRDKSIQYQLFLLNSQDKKNITNIKYLDNFLYFTTSDTTYYKKLGDPKMNKVNMVGDENMHSGADPHNFDINSEKKILLSTSVTYYIEEYNWMDNSYIKLITKAYERQTRFTQFFKNYYVFVLYEEEKPSLCVYDPLNNIFISLDETYKLKDILSVVTGNDRIYVLSSNLEKQVMIEYMYYQAI